MIRALLICVLFFAAPTRADSEEVWPPQLYQTFPDVAFTDADGGSFRMSSLQGSVVLVEYIGMSCPGCQAYSGGNKAGGFGGVSPQGGIKSIEEYLPEYGGVNLEDVVFVQILLYDLHMGVPTAEDAKAWAAHFGLTRDANTIVVVGTKAIQDQGSYDLIPGFHLLDRGLTVRSDSAGHRPKQNLYTDLIPMIKELLGERYDG